MIIQRTNSRVIAVLIHILVWLVLGLAIFFYPPFSSDIVFPYQLWIKQAILVGVLAGAYYINSQVLMPRLLLKNYTGYYFICIISLILAFIAVNAYIDKWLNLDELIDAAFRRHGPPKHHKNGSHFDVITPVIMALVLGIGTSITAIQKWQADKQLHLALQQEKTSSELSFLKAQINPHFFFNTLNNIYALTYADAETSRKAIHQLSRMMRYLLYDTPQEHTMLSQEIIFIKDYISLMQLRLTNAVKINFESPEILTDVPIASMLFLPFLENAFKHGVSTTENSYIDINIELQDKQLEMTVKNSIIKNLNAAPDEYGGIGLENTRRRLDLLYPGKHELTISSSADTNEYRVHLKLDLA